MKRKGFTLIELLIVVAIIAILALIAVPNFLEAQVRSKVSRVKSDLRNLATALEAYRTDNVGYPPYGPYPPPDTGQAGVLNPMWLTTPIAYLTSAEANLSDPFRTHIPPIYYYSRYYRYTNWDDWRYYDNAWVHYIWGEWRLICAGPDGWYFSSTMEGPDGQPTWALRVYDPTNGTVSLGDIFRSQKEGDNIRIPIDEYS